MLVLTRKNGESVQIGDAVSVKVLAISGNRVKLGFSAPGNVAIRRAEISATISLPLDGWRSEQVELPSHSQAVC
jgi:carbon storage regulator